MRPGAGGWLGVLIDQVLSALEQLVTSPWIYAALLGMSLLDSMIPVFPSEAPIILAASYAASTGTPHVAGVFASAAVGAWIGDHVTYFIGRTQAARVEGWPAESRRARGVRMAQALLSRRGGMALVVARFIPWGRIAVTFVMGATRYPLRSYSAYDALGTGVWAFHGCLLGYVGGVAFQNEPVKAMALGIGMAMVVSVLVELGRWWWGRRRGRTARRGTDTEAADAAPSATVPAPPRLGSPLSPSPRRRR